MNLRKAVFVFGGGGLIILILAYRFGLFAKVKKTVQPVWDRQVKVKLADKGKKTPPPVSASPARKAPAKAAPVAQEKKAEISLNQTQMLQLAQEIAGVSSKNLNQKIRQATSEIMNSEAFREAVAKTEKSRPAVKKQTEKEPAVEKLQEEQPVQQKESVISGNIDPVQSNGLSQKKELNPLGLGDPFAYAANGAGNYTPLSGGKSVGTIAVKGIIRLEGQEPVAILSLGTNGRVYYVRKGDVIRVNMSAKKGAVRSEAYIVIQEIREEEVELIQQERPDKVIIIR